MSADMTLTKGVHLTRENTPKCVCGHSELDHHGFEDECLEPKCLCIEWKAAKA